MLISLKLIQSWQSLSTYHRKYLVPTVIRYWEKHFLSDNNGIPFTGSRKLMGKKYISRKIKREKYYSLSTRQYPKALWFVVLSSHHRKATVKQKNLNALFGKILCKYLRILPPSKVVPTEEFPDCVVKRVDIARGWCGQPS